MAINEIANSFVFVANANFFYQAMALVTIIGSMIGAILYNGHVELVKKGAISILCYGGLILLTNISRLLSSPAGLFNRPTMMGQQFNGSVTVVYVTAFYLLGLILGVWAHRHSRRHSLAEREEITVATKSQNTQKRKTGKSLKSITTKKPGKVRGRATKKTITPKKP